MYVGPDTLVETLPTSVTVDDQPYILDRGVDNEVVLFDAICPHQGGVVRIDGGENQYRCPQHDWTFEPKTGECTNTLGGDSLNKYAVTRRDGGLYADIDTPDEIEFTVDIEDKKPTIELISHATLLVEYDEFTLVTDPWIEGHAVLDAWLPYPPATRSTQEIAAQADAIWITHEHSDHLHIPTLSEFDSEIPVYIPGENADRLSSRISEAGLENIHALSMEIPYKLAENVEAVCFESESTWYDSLLVLDCGGFRILNENDAGINWRVKDMVPNIDFIAASFSFGASGFPLAWHQVDEEKKQQIMRSRNKNCLQTCRQLVEMFDADYLLPFAKYMGLVGPARAVRNQMEKNTPWDVEEFLQGDEVEVLDLLPGERWIGETGECTQRESRMKLFDQEFKTEYLEQAHREMDTMINCGFDLSHEEIGAYFEALSGSELTRRVGNHAFSLHLTSDDRELYGVVIFQNGEVSYESASDLVGFEDINTDTHVIMKCQGDVVQFIIENDWAWDTIGTGHVGDFWRDPDTYNLHFWRLLHAPWEARNDEYRWANEHDIDTQLEGVPIANLVEINGVEELLMEYGMNCIGCPTGKGEDIIEASAIHGLREEQAKTLIHRLEETVPAKVLQTSPA